MVVIMVLVLEEENGGGSSGKVMCVERKNMKGKERELKRENIKDEMKEKTLL